MFWDVFWYIVLLLPGALTIAAIVVLINLNRWNKIKKSTLWLLIIVSIIVYFGLSTGLQTLKKKSQGIQHYDSIQTLVEDIFPEDSIDSIVVEGNYAGIFLEDQGGNTGKWYSTKRDDEGWQYISDTSKRIVLEYYDGYLFIVPCNDDEKDLIVFNDEVFRLYMGYDYENYAPDISDTEGSDFKELTLKSGQKIYYTFVDVDIPNYSLKINGKSLNVGEIDYGPSGTYIPDNE